MFKKCARCAVCFFLMLVCSVPCFGAQEPSVSATGAVLINGQTLEVLCEKDARTRTSMASTTKIMTALLALEHGNNQQVVQVTPEMVNVEGTSMGLQAGDYATLETLVAGMLLESGNDAANATAYAVGGNLVDFAEMMNQKAAQIGMADTHFVTPSGLDHEEHYTTAYDMALLGAYALQNPVFKAICSAESMVVSFGNPAAKRTLRNHNKMLSLYDGAVGVKTGFTKKSGRCLVSAAERNGVLLVAVTLNAPNDWDDTAALFDYGFEQTKVTQLDTGEREFQLDLVGGTAQKVRLTLANPVQYACTDPAALHIITKVYLTHFAYAPVEQGDILGYSCYYNNDQLIESVPIVAAETLQALPVSEKAKKKTFKQTLQNLFQKIKEFFKHGQ